MGRIRMALVAALLVCGTATMAHAQAAQQDTGRGAMMGRRGSMADRMLQGITLTTDQQGKVQAIEEKYRGQMMQLRQDANGGRPDRAKMRDLMQQESAEIRGVLTADQQKVYDQNLQEMRERMRNRMRDTTGGR